jgi:hypothetical protein
MHRSLVVALAMIAAAGCGKLAGGGTTKAASASSAIVAQPAAPSPKILITQPVRASFMAPGAAAVAGNVVLVTSTAAVTTVELAGQHLPVDPRTGAFRAMVTLTEGLNVLEATCVDAQGRQGSTAVGVLAGTFKPVNQYIPSSTVARISDAALDAAGKLGEGGIWNTDWTAVLKALNPIYDTNFLWIKVWIDIDQVRFRDVNVTLDSRVGSAHGTIKVYQPVLDVTIVADLGFARIGPFTALVEADDIDVQGNLGIAVRQDGTFQASTSSPAAVFSNFRMTVSNGVVDTAVQLFAKGAIERAIRNFLTDALTQKLPTIMNSAIAEFLQQQNPWLLLGKPFQIDIRGEHVTFEEDGLTFAVKFNASSGPPIPAAQRAPGSFSTAGASPAVDKNRGFFVTVDDDGFNRALHMMWAGGHLNVDLDEAFLQQNNITLPIRLEAGNLRRFLPEIGGIIPDSSPVRLRIGAALPPIVRMTGHPDLAILEAGEISIEVQVDRGAGYEKLLRAIVQVELGGDVALGSQGLEVSSLGSPRFRFDLVDEPIVELDDRRLEVLLSVMLTPTIPHVLNSLRVVGIPHLNQLTTFNVDIHPGGPQTEHLVVGGDMTR